MSTRDKIFPQFYFIAVFFLIILSSIIIFSPIAALSAQVMLAWDPPITAEGLAGYKLYYGIESGNYAYSIDVGNQTTYTISDLETDCTYYFSATAYDTNANESDFAEEVSTMMIYEDAEDGNTQGWMIYYEDDTKARIRNVFDKKIHSRVIKFKGSRTDSKYVLRNEDGTPWHNSKERTIQWRMNYREDFVVYLDVETTAGHRYISYTPDDYDDLGSGEYVYYGLGSLAKDGQWRTFTRDLQTDLEAAQSGVSILEVNGFIIRGSGKVDDIQLLQLYNP